MDYGGSSVDDEHKHKKYYPGICPNPVRMLENYWTGKCIPVPCKKWTCPHCSRWMRKKILDRITLGFGKDSKEYYFMVLTDHIHPDDISKHFNHFRIYLNRSYQIDKYFWTKEFTPPAHNYLDRKGNLRRSVGGVKHMNVLLSFVDKVPEKQFLKDLWLASNGDSYEISFEKVNTYSPAGYMMKYVTKAFQDDLYMKNENRIMFSRSFPKLQQFKLDVAYSNRPLYEEEKTAIDIEIAKRIDAHKQKHFKTENWIKKEK